MLLLTLPEQGHVVPLMKLALCLVDKGVKVTFLTLKVLHEQLVRALPEMDSHQQQQKQVRIVSFPDGLETEDERRNSNKLMHSIDKVMPGQVEVFIKKANQTESDEKITCVIADLVVAWALEIARKMGLKRVAFLSSTPAILAIELQVSKRIEAGIVDIEGKQT